MASRVTSAKCREARRRRMEMRRLAVIAGRELTLAGQKSRGEEKKEEESDRTVDRKRDRTVGANSGSGSSSSSEGVESPSIPSASVQVPAIIPVSIFGSLSVSGRSRDMEDAISLRPDFFRPETPGRHPLHFFAVFDGHGGSHVAILCKENMHVFLNEELERVLNLDAAAAGVSDSGLRLSAVGWNSAMGACFKRMDELSLSSCDCGGHGTPCRCEHGGARSDIVGSTAVVAVVDNHRIVVANCGDSRAVLSRDRRAIPLSEDHKPDRPDELARIEAAGGRVIYLNGARVLGILAMSRAIGDKYLKPIVISEPEVNVMERHADDECLILASDGLWDVLSNELACDIARRCLHEGSQSSMAKGAPSSGAELINGDDAVQVSRSRCSLAAALLTRLALGRKSGDNISVIVVDLKQRREG
ncbi:protein phosphatase 2C family protein [Tasmannia lanceolata]|uniref:protein phosphatase 2C family protein n=1 Tax=Tasmannia lanceolata TaxID=3420 RepID=UPI0040631140